MFQKEFAERLVAETGDNLYGRLALNVRLFSKVTRVCKVDRGSFNPPPKVDSMVVRFAPRDPPVDVDFREWDGLLRVCFGRKRKTLACQFKTKAVLSLLEANYRTWCAMHNTPPVLLGIDLGQSQPMLGVGNSVNGNANAANPNAPLTKKQLKKQKQGKSKGRNSAFSAHIVAVLEGLDLHQERAINMELDVFLKLLLAFNQKGIHFSNAGGQGGATGTGKKQQDISVLFDDGGGEGDVDGMGIGGDEEHDDVDDDEMGDD